MVSIKPFKGIRYNLEKTLLKNVIAPPYDVIDAHLRESFLSKCPYNIVQIDLPIGGEDRYEKAAEAYKTWKETGVLVKDPEPAYYIYEQEYEYNGKTIQELDLLG